MKLPEIITMSVEALAKLQGIGEKTAFRMVMNMTNWNSVEIDSFTNAISEIKNLKKCNECGLYSDESLCSICLDPNRSNSKLICVVENISDLLAIEKSGQFKGLFHILGGVLNPLMGIGPDELHLEELVRRVKNLKVEEMILAINPSVEGDATCAYMKNIFPDHIKIERIGFGIPIGGSLEYLDALTIGKALENRKLF
jgi:recombination protein RecR